VCEPTIALYTAILSAINLSGIGFFCRPDFVCNGVCPSCVHSGRRRR
jgi:hypothetical protein